MQIDTNLHELINLIVFENEKKGLCSNGRLRPGWLDAASFRFRKAHTSGSLAG